MTLKTKFFFLSPFLMFCLHCGSGHESAGGAVGETTNGQLSGIVYHTDGSPASARINLYNPATGEIIGTTESKNDGKFSLRKSSSNFHIEAIRKDSSSMSWRWNQYEDLTSDSEYDIQLQPPVQISGTLLDPENQVDANAQICLRGTPYCTNPANQLFSFNTLPPGSYSLEARSSTSELMLGSVNALDSSVLDLTLTAGSGFLFEDFNDADRAHLLRSSAGETYWYVMSADDFIFTNIASASVIGTAMTFDNAWEGRSLHLEYNPGTSFGQLGTYLMGDESPVDMTGLNSVKMLLRGDGIVQFAIEEGRAESGNRKAQFEVTLSEDWTEYEFIIGQEQSLLDYPQAVPFSEIQNRIRLITLFIKSGTFLSADQIRFEGVGPEIFSKL
jgi:hypothetical protein